MQALMASLTCIREACRLKSAVPTHPFSRPQAFRTRRSLSASLRLHTAPADPQGPSGSQTLPAELQRSDASNVTVHVPDPSTAPDLPTALKLLRQQPSHYVVASMGGQRHLLAPRDLLTVPRIKHVSVGEVLSLDAVHELGSRDFTIRGEPTLPEEVVHVSAVVVEHTKGEMERIVKKKRRKGYKKTIEHKQTYTRLRISDIAVGGTM